MKREIASEFPGYRQFDDGESALGMSFYLAKDIDKPTSVLMLCYRGAPGKLAKCGYWGRYNATVAYRFSFPGEELDRFPSLIAFVESSITDLIDDY